MGNQIMLWNETPPWIVNGEERGSYTNRHYSIRTDEQGMQIKTNKPLKNRGFILDSHIGQNNCTILSKNDTQAENMNLVLN